MTRVDLPLAERLIERWGIPLALLVVVGALYLGFLDSPLLRKLEAHDRNNDELLHLQRAQCANLAYLAQRDPSTCWSFRPDARPGWAAPVTR